MTDVDSQTEFYAQLKGYEGREVGPPVTARDEVNQAMIRHWCDAMGDANPIYTDAAAARAAGHPGVVAPPAMLQAWTMPGFGRQMNPSGLLAEIYRALRDHGFTTAVATNCSQTYIRYLQIGDLLTQTEAVHTISPEKKTALGPGHFLTTRRSYRVADGELVATMEWTVFFYRPGAVA